MVLRRYLPYSYALFPLQLLHHSEEVQRISVNRGHPDDGDEFVELTPSIRKPYARLRRHFENG